MVSPTSMAGAYFPHMMQRPDGPANQNTAAMGAPIGFGAAHPNQGPMIFGDGSGLPPAVPPFTTMPPSHATVPRNMTVGGPSTMGPGHGRNMSTGQMRDRSPQYMHTSLPLHGAPAKTPAQAGAAAAATATASNHNRFPSVESIRSDAIGTDDASNNTEHDAANLTPDDDRTPAADVQLPTPSAGLVINAADVMAMFPGGSEILNSEQAQAEQEARRVAGTAPTRKTRKPRASSDCPMTAKRRRTQNCISQRTYRQRKENLIKMLTQDVKALSERLASSLTDIGYYMATIDDLRRRLATLEQRRTSGASADTSSGVSPAHTQPTMLATAPSSAHVSPAAAAMAQQMGLSPADMPPSAAVGFDMMAHSGMVPMTTHGLFDAMPTAGASDGVLDMPIFGDHMLSFPGTTPGAENDFFPNGLP